MKSDRKVCLITGSAAGIGAASAIKLAQQGYNVVINYSRSESDARDTAAQCEAAGAQALVLQGDVSDDTDCRRLANETLDRWGRIDALVNNAGTTKYVEHSNLEGLTPEDFHRIFSVNVYGTYQMVRAVTPAMKEAGHGVVVNVSSIAGVQGTGSSVAYAASKGAVNTMTQSLARVLAPEVRINALCPGFVGTRWQRQGQGDKYDQVVADVEKTTPLQHACSAEDIADMVVMLVQGAPYMTGETLLVDAGSHL